MLESADQPETTLRAKVSDVYQRLQHRRGRGCFRACLVTILITMAALSVVWLYVSRNLGSLVSELVRDQANAALNGRLEFDELDVDLAGRALMRGARVYLSGTSDPVIEAKSITVSMNFFRFIGPNRGTRSLNMVADEARIVLVREADGSFNLSRLAKPEDPQQERQDIALSIRLKRGQLHFTDLALLDQSYPDLGAHAGLLGAMLDEAGYVLGGPAESRPHQEVLSAEGNVAYNAKREEAQFNLRFKRQASGGLLTGRGSLRTDGSRFKIDLSLINAGLDSISAYVHHVFPQMAVIELTNDGKVVGNQTPLLGGKIERMTIALLQMPQAELSVDAEADLRKVTLRSNSLPQLDLSRALLSYDTKRKQAYVDFELDSLGVSITGKPTLDLGSQELGGNLRFTGIDVSKVLAGLKQPVLPVTGKIDAKIGLLGPSSAPGFSVTLSSELLKYERLTIGKLNGEVELLDGVLKSSGVKISGGNVPFTILGIQFHCPSQRRCFLGQKRLQHRQLDCWSCNSKTGLSYVLWNAATRS